MLIEKQESGEHSVYPGNRNEYHYQIFDDLKTILLSGDIKR